MNAKQGEQEGAGAAQVRPRFRRYAMLAVLVLLGLALCAAGLWAVRLEFLAPRISAHLVEQARRSGGTLQIGSWSGDWTRTVAAQDLAWTHASHRLAQARIDSLQVSIRPWNWLRGNSAVVETVRAQGAALRIDLGRASSGAGAAWGVEDLHRLPGIELERARLELGLGTATKLVLEGANLRLDPAGQQSRALHVRAARAEFVDQAGTRAGPLDAEMVLQGPYLVLRSLRFDCARFGPGLTLDRGQLDLAQALAGHLVASAGGSTFDGQLDLRTSGTVDDLFVSGESRSVDLAGVFELIEPNSLPPQGRLNSTFQLRRFVLAAGATWSGPFDASLEGPCLGSLPLASIAGRGELADGQAIFEELSVDQGSNRVLGRNVVLPLASPSWIDVLSAPGVHLELELHDFLQLWPERAARGLARQFELPLYRARLDANITQQGIEIASGSLRTRGGSFEIGPSHVRWSASGPRDWRKAAMQIDLGCEFRDLGELGRVLGFSDWTGACSGFVRSTGTFDDPKAALDLSGTHMAAGGEELSNVILRARVDSRVFSVQEGVAETRWGKLHVFGDVDWRARLWQETALWIEAGDLNQVWPERFQTGSASAAVLLDGPLDDPTFQAELSIERAQLTEAWGGLSGKRIDGLALAAVRTGASVRVEPAVVSAYEAELELAGTCTPTGGRLMDWTWPVELELTRAVGRSAKAELTLDAPAAISLAPNEVRAPQLRLSGWEGKLEGALAWEPGRAQVQAEFERFDPMPLLAPFVDSGFEIKELSGAFDLSVGGAGLAATAQIQGAQVQFGADSAVWTARATAQTTADGVELREVVLETGAESSVRFDLDLGLMRSAAGWPRGIDWSRTTGLKSQGRLESLALLPVAWTRGLGASKGALSWELAIDRLQGGTSGFAELDLKQWELDDTASPVPLGPGFGSARLRFEPAPVLDYARVEWPAWGAVQASGRVEAPLWLDQLLQGDLSALAHSELDVQTQLEVNDLTPLVAAGLALRRIDGRVAAELAWRGSLAQPQPSGWIEWRDGSLRLLGEIPSLAEIQARAQLADGRLTIEHCRGELGSAPWTVAGYWDLSAPEADGQFRMRGTDVLLTRSQDLRLRADMDLALEISASRRRLSGEVLLTDARYARRHEILTPGGRGSRPAPLQLFSLSDPGLAEMALDVKIRTGSEAAQIDSNIARGGARADLQLGGTGRSPELTGALFFEPTRVLLPATTLTLTTGTATLDRREPLLPRLDLQLEGRVRGYDVRARIGGSLTSPTTDLSSVPPLSHEDLVLLIASGQTPQEREGGLNRNEAARSLATFFGRDILAGLGGDADGGGIAERIEWQTGTDLTRSGAATSEVSLRLTREIKQSGRSMFLRAERDVYDRINLGLRFLFRVN